MRTHLLKAATAVARLPSPSVHSLSFSSSSPARRLLSLSTNATRPLPSRTAVNMSVYPAASAAAATPAGMTNYTAFDFRSDTVTKPTPAMFEAMQRASLGDDVFNDDDSIHELEQRVASMAGKEAGLFVVSGTMSNQLALRVHLNALQSVVCDARSHIFRYEAGGVSYHSGAQVVPIEVPEGSMLTADLIRPKLVENHDDCHFAHTHVISLENTLNGQIFPFDDLAKIRDLAKEKNLIMHLDGARLWNASAETGISIRQYADLFDTVSLCLSKGLGAPIGSVLVGPSAFIKKARHFRKVFGGGWRQAGMLAGAAMHVLDHHLPRLHEDHVLAQKLAAGLRELGFPIHSCSTNMVFVNPLPTSDAWPQQGAGIGFFAKPLLQEFNVRVIDGNPHGVARLVIHHQIGAAGVEALLSGLKTLIARHVAGR